MHRDRVKGEVARKTENEIGSSGRAFFAFDRRCLGVIPWEEVRRLVDSSGLAMRVRSGGYWHHMKRV